MSTRQEIADAANTVDGIAAEPFYRQSTTPGDAHVRLERVAYPDRFGSVNYWNVVVLLPQDTASAEQYLEEKLPQLRAALAPVMAIREAVPQRLNLPGVGDLPCVFINGHREE